MASKMTEAVESPLQKKLLLFSRSIAYFLHLLWSYLNCFSWRVFKKCVSLERNTVQIIQRQPITKHRNSNEKVKQNKRERERAERMIRSSASKSSNSTTETPRVRACV